MSGSFPMCCNEREVQRYAFVDWTKISMSICTIVFRSPDNPLRHTENVNELDILEHCASLRWTSHWDGGEQCVSEPPNTTTVTSSRQETSGVTHSVQLRLAEGGSGMDSPLGLLGSGVAS